MYARFVVDDTYRFDPPERVRVGRLMDLPDEPVLSVIVPVYNGAKVIGATLESILSQDYDRLDVMVMDGGSTDGTVEVARGFASDRRVRIFSERDRCPNEATLKGLKMANGHLFAVQCASDVYRPGVFRRAVEEFRADPSLFCVGGHCLDIQVDGTIHVWDEAGKDAREYLTVDQALAFVIPPVQSSFFRREVLFTLGGFDERFGTCHTVYYLHFLLEGMRMGGRALMVPEVWGEFTRSQGSVTGKILGQIDDVYKQRILTVAHALRIYGDFLTEAQKDYARRRLYLPEEVRERLASFQLDRTPDATPSGP